MMVSFRGYPEISILNPQMRYFQKNVNYPFFKNGDFGGYDLENWVWTKLALWICPNYIMDSGKNSLYTTFPNIFLLLANSADLSTNQKNHIFEKMLIFE